MVIRFLSWLSLLVLAVCPAWSQELEPRAYRALPSDLNFIVFAYSFSTGNVILDPTLPIEDLEADIHVASVAYLRTLAMGGRSASISVAAPQIYMAASGNIEGEFQEGSRRAWGDARARLTVNLLGGPAMSLSEYKNFRQGRSLGLGLTVVMPTGQYNSSNLVNFGSNRWSFKPEIGYSSVRKNWIFDMAAGVWLFTTNNDGYQGTTQRQDPIASLQGHVSYNFPKGIWLALDGNYFAGGRTSVNGVDQSDLQENSRWGLTLSLPLVRRHSLKLAAHTGAFTRTGADFDVGSIAYQYQWGGS